MSVTVNYIVHGSQVATAAPTGGLIPEVGDFVSYGSAPVNRARVKFRIWAYDGSGNTTVTLLCQLTTTSEPEES
jgi:hypothetical protein